MEIIRAKNDNDCEICDEFLSKLINFESDCDNIILKNVKVKNIHTIILLYINWRFN